MKDATNTISCFFLYVNDINNIYKSLMELLENLKTIERLYKTVAYYQDSRY